MTTTMTKPTAETALKTIAHFAPKGVCVGVAVHDEGGERRVRLYAAAHDQIWRFDQLLTPGYVDALNARIAVNSFHVPIENYGFDHTDGTKTSGLWFTPNRGVNTIAFIIYELAAIIHGDRKAWTYNIL